ncbi:gamma-glutamyl-gamma-aminobutyrate hydrolase [Serratia rhizosphaerae]|uniref:gamma-glutamyl-gamma-aminobutyrate hydrolase n=1 Tax=unclassified Serratia (in: enterobacteria) TaxID=2647522 RepID=UPI000CF6870C|nr:MULTISPECIES: gamma-glutamyl-gamma-aminobutyrate hydrolase [unclassified Serratia (in: enterobacteria)]MBU3891218.1 gamma-glutamyl-gamma-aminobutyrate hydrolase [Serratia rubidaea]AVJ17334.1 gamma-glutamyl-gamma-aminobutyrate hydrolase [Serratia sp. MYb239]MCA4822248.1 gamma-glutamyl-gamma-aminobutyrate hydrolase [Serratia rubidaea]QNK30797.1 gamma-glutamyl-gamma-aminobutyrate hydrolase [Serratia sp. JUb9]QPT15339.1 gamma-glutamyl-gamma-aminobutyrate hydrolase [Serratia rubidaea]
MGNIFNRPVIGVVMCRHRLKQHPTQTLQEKYLNAVLAAGGLPVALPHALAEPEILADLLPRLDGIMLPGSPSNVQPHLYGENGDEPDADPGRDALSLALIRLALDRRIPLFAICRGMQEMVVATGGTLHRRLYELPELQEHREDHELPLEQQYAPAHEVIVREGGLLSQLIPDCNRFWVNSLHGQGAKTLGPSVRVEAHAADGLVEAISIRDQPFALGVQWHPEWNSDEYALSRLLFAGFIDACRAYRKEPRP